MKKYNFYAIFSLTLLMFCSLSSAFAEEGHGHDEHAEGGKKEFNPAEMIMHHIGDSHEWHIASWDKEDGTEAHLTIPLPVILYTEGNFDIFLSSEFHHGEATVKRDGREYRNHHEHIEEVSGKSVIDLSLTKNAASMMIGAFIIVFIFTSVAGAYKKRDGQAPKGLQAFMEPLILFIRDDIAIPNIGEKKYKKYLPYLLTLFFFIWINNLLGLIPTGANASGNIAFTMVLAVFTLIITNVSGNKDYWMHILWTPGVPLPLRIIMLPVEVIGIFTKPFALMVRLLANITAGHIIILSLLSFIFIFKSMAVGVPVTAFVIVMNFLELFVAALQSYIFTLLTALFIGLAVAEHDDHH